MMTNFFDIEGNIREDNDPEYGKQSTSKFFVLMSTQFFRTFNGCVLCRMRSSPNNLCNRRATNSDKSHTDMQVHKGVIALIRELSEVLSLR